MQRILNVLSWVGVALVFGAVALRVALWFGAGSAIITPERDRYIVWAAYAGLALVLLYTAGQWREILTALRRRQTRYGALATASVAIALALLVAVNYLSFRQNKRWDLTENATNSLSEQSAKVVAALTAPIKILAFDRQSEFDRYRQSLDNYSYVSPQVEVEYIDPDTKPVQAREYEIQSYGTVIVEYNQRRERAQSDAEQDVTNAIIRATSGTERTVYFLQGHGEKDPASMDRDGYGAVAAALERDNYTVEPLVLAQQKDVPDNATVVILAGPTSDLLPEEIDALRRYLDRAGKLMVLVDPEDPSKPALANIDALVREWGIALGNNVVVDVSGATADPAMAVAASYPSHPITDRFGTLTLYRLARSVEPVTGAPAGRVAQSIVETSAGSWAESDTGAIAAQRPVGLDPEAGDKPGPVSIAAAVAVAPPSTDATPAADGDAANAEAPKPETRVVAFGDSDFATNASAGIPGNPNLFANAVNWLAQQENLIAIRPAQAGDRRVTLTAGAQRAVTLLVLALPVAIFAGGIYSSVRRRRR